MLNIGMKIILTYPNYAIGTPGKLLRKETTGRWLVKLEKNSSISSEKSSLLSLAESEFAVVEQEVFT